MARVHKAKPLSLRLLVPMIIITAAQFLVFVGVFLLSGEFNYIKQYAYDSFVEKSDNRKSYVESMLNQKTDNVYNTAVEINEDVEELLEENGQTVSDIQTDKDLNREIISQTAPLLIELMRRDQVNDAFIVLDSGELYYDDDSEGKSAIYFRDNDPTQSGVSNNEDLLVELGNSEVAEELGIALDFEWAARLDVSESTGNDTDFYSVPINASQGLENNKSVRNYGYWSGFSKISRSAQPSIKYTLPLVTEDGEVYGIVGIGLTEKFIQELLPVNDYFYDQMCFVMCADFENDGEFEMLMHSGAMYNRLVDDNTVISYANNIEGDVYDFNPDSSIDSIGSIQEMSLYDSDSVYKSQKWAIAAIGKRDGIMAIYTQLVRLFVVSGAVSLTICFIGAIIVSKRYTKPVRTMINKLENGEICNDRIVEFESTYVKEIDRLGKSITNLQINVMENASRVSRLIGMVDMGIGVFTYSYSDHSVFIGESLIKLFAIEELAVRDCVISFDMFKKYISRFDMENKVCSDSLFTQDVTNEDTSRLDKKDIVLSGISPSTGKKVWYKFSLTRDMSSVIGLVQDVTSNVIEKQRIEYERDYDITTGLLNRRAYLSRLSELFEHREKMKIAAIIMIDLDNLKYVNDTYGHDYGDDYIRGAANVFREFEDYGGLVARMSGDEFNVCLSGFENKNEIRRIVDKVHEKLMDSSCVLADGSSFKLRASGGIAWYPDNSIDCEQLIKYADFAMYSVKHSIKGSIAEFDMNVYKKDSILMTGIEEMNRIIEEEAVRFAFQPIVSVKDAKLYGYEILMRPQSDILKTPLDFIRIARTGGKLYEVERLTWLKGLEAFQDQIDGGNIDSGIKVFVNSLSNCLVNQNDIKQIEEDFGSLLSDVVLEVLEGEKENERFTKEKLKLIQSWNARIALDDYGSGYNSEYLLITLEPDIIKIDRSIISGCDRDEGRLAIIVNIIRTARVRNVKVLAEGVETQAELETVIRCGVDFLQGYYIGHPLLEPVKPDDEVIKQIERFNKEEEF